MFLLFSIAMMWLMIFGAGCLYYGMLPKEQRSHVITITTVSLLTTCVAWLFFGYSIAFNSPLLLFDDTTTMDTLLNTLFQLCFCLYAIVMVIGSVIDRLTIKQAILIPFIWTLLVYAPLVRLFWHTDGLLAQLGALDFSGGMVVHLSAGVASYVLAHAIPKKHHFSTTIQNEWLYLGMIFITLGWFFFNAGPVGELNTQSVRIVINTLFALITGGGIWAILQYKLDKSHDTATLLNGTIVGLVTSTSSVGYTNLWQLLLIVAFASGLTYLAIRNILSRFNIDDVVDSFGMNGIGGLLGSIGTVIFFPNAFIGQLLGILLTIILSVIITKILITMTQKF